MKRVPKKNSTRTEHTRTDRPDTGRTDTGRTHTDRTSTGRSDTDRTGMDRTGGTDQFDIGRTGTGRTSTARVRNSDEVRVVDGHELHLTHLDQDYFPRDAISKRMVVDYYHKIAPLLVSYSRGHPVVMHRFPSGIDGESFYHKNVPPYFPSWIDRIDIELKTVEGVTHGLLVNKTADLVYIANQGCITPHLWLSSVPDLTLPDKIIFDLDPTGVEFAAVVRVALVLKKVLEGYALVPYVMTTGSKGLHVVVFITPVVSFEHTKKFALRCAGRVFEALAELVTLELRKESRSGKVFIDCNRNAYGQTGVAPYALRALDHAPVALPVRWLDLATMKSAQAYTLRTIFRRLGQVGDAWQGYETCSFPAHW